MVHRADGGIAQGSMSAVAALLAYLPTRALGLREGFWAAITAVAVVQTEFGSARNTARDQLAGASIGGAIGVMFAAVAGQHLGSYAGALIVSMLLCWILRVPSAARLGGITATIILLVPHPGSAQSMMLSRVGEVGWGVVVAIAVVWLVNTVEGAIAARRTGG
jgi:uncharacterized membrane protein YgaE (UPF0421/DUF939 family)